MTESASTVLTSTRRALHGIAECLLAGPEYAATGEIALRVTAQGIATTAGPPLELAGTTLVSGEQRLPAEGRFGDLAGALGVRFGAPALGYRDGSGVGPDDVIELDPDATRLLLDWFILSDRALRLLAPEQDPVLWPEHFDVAVLLDDRSYGSSPGDEAHAGPYAYVSAAEHDGSPFFNAPFGALRPAAEVGSVEALLAFWREGHERLRAV